MGDSDRRIGGIKRRGSASRTREEESALPYNVDV
jgi:hypothetical protein